MTMEQVSMLGIKLTNKQATNVLTVTTIGTALFAADLLFDWNPAKKLLASFNIGKSATAPKTSIVM